MKMVCALALALAAPCAAELRFDWSKTTLHLPEQKKIEEHVTAAANRYLQGYGHFGPYDFVNSDKTYIVTFTDLMEPGMYLLRRDDRPGVIMLDNVLSNDMNILEMTAIHEFSHAYDDHFMDIVNISPRTMGEKVKAVQLLLDVQTRSQERAVTKEQRYVTEMEKVLPHEQYRTLKQWQLFSARLREETELAEQPATVIKNSAWKSYMIQLIGEGEE
ncbi:hypothetical protein HY639_04020 [Candidatus Woesearchaeota archaeon]|nr:hypothetical protein [Candidatus Woesearchaeota archaeon]